MVHALALAGVVLLAAPLALHIPLAVLAGILLFIAWNMGEWHEFARLRNLSNHYRLLMLGTFFITVVFDLTLALEVGMVLACVLFVRRMTSLFTVEEVSADERERVYKLHGALFFGAVAKTDGMLQVAEGSAVALLITLDLSELISLDTSGLDALEQLRKALAARLCQVQAQPLSLMQRTGFIDSVEVL